MDQTWFAGASWARPVFDLSGGYLDSRLLVDSVSFITFDNLEIKNEQLNTFNSSYQRGSITVYGGTSITIENCMFTAGTSRIPSWAVTKTPSVASPFTTIRSEEW